MMALLFTENYFITSNKLQLVVLPLSALIFYLLLANLFKVNEQTVNKNIGANLLKKKKAFSV